MPFLDRYQALSGAANARHLEGLVGVKDPSDAQRTLAKRVAKASRSGKSLRGFNLTDGEDARLFAAVLPGQHVINRIRNKDLLEQLFGGDPADRREARRRSTRIMRLLNRLHAQGSIARVPRTHRSRATDRVRAVMSAVIDIRENAFPEARSKADAAYDAAIVYEAIAGHDDDRSPRVLIPPRTGALVVADAPNTRQRNRNIRERARLSKRRWRVESGFSKRSKVETTLHRCKATLGQSMQARGLASQRVEARIGRKIFNTMTALGMPDGKMIG